MKHVDKDTYSGDRIAWNPIKGTPGFYTIDSFTHTFNGLIINLSRENAEDTKLCISFDTHQAICRVMNESYRMRLASEYSVMRRMGTLSPSFSPICIINNSRYMKELCEESYDLIEIYGFRHYFIEDEEWTFDIASPVQPKLELFINGELVDAIAQKTHATM